MAYLAFIVEDVVINKWDISVDVMIMGRAKDCDVQIDDQSVSSKHARLVVEKDPFLDGNSLIFIEDLQSTNGTQVNGRSIGREKLVNGDLIKIGFNQFRFVSGEPQGLEDTAVIIN